MPAWRQLSGRQGCAPQRQACSMICWDLQAQNQKLFDNFEVGSCRQKQNGYCATPSWGSAGTTAEVDFDSQSKFCRLKNKLCCMTLARLAPT